MTEIVVVDTATGAALPGIPTPRLIQAGGGEAYFVPNTGPSKDRIPGIWYLHEFEHKSPAGGYTRVRIVER